MPSAKSSRNGRNEIRQVQTTGQWKSLSHPLIYHGRGKLLIFGYRHRWLWHFKGGGSKLPCMRKGTISISTTAPAECFASPEPLPILTGHAHHKGPEIADPERSVPWCRYSELAKNRGATIAATKPCSKLWHEVVARWLNLGEPLKHRGQEAVPHTCLYDLLLHSNILTYMYVGMSCGHKTQSKKKHDLRYQLYCIYIHTSIYAIQLCQKWVADLLHLMPLFYGVSPFMTQNYSLSQQHLARSWLPPPVSLLVVFRSITLHIYV